MVGAMGGKAQLSASTAKPLLIKERHPPPLDVIVLDEDDASPILLCFAFFWCGSCVCSVLIQRLPWKMSEIDLGNRDG